MPFTGDLEHLPIVDIIQLVHSTRKSGIFSIKAGEHESRIVFSSGYIVSANHINDSVRIGSVLVKMGAITLEDLKEALAGIKSGAHKKTLLAVLIESGKLKREDAQRGLKKLVEMTIVELMSWTKGTFTFDTDAVFDVAEGGAPVGLDAQMVLMDALRVFDERERDKEKGKEVPSFESIYADVLPEENARPKTAEGSMITEDILGLADLDKLERKIPQPLEEMQAFDPVQIHREQVQELLHGFSAEEQEAVVNFLRKSAGRKPSAAEQSEQANKAVVMFSNDAFVTHLAMTLCNQEGIPVFTTADEAELERMVSHCVAAMRVPVVVFDSPSASEAGFSEEKITALRKIMKEKYARLPRLQLASPNDKQFILRSYQEGVMAVLPKPLKELQRETYVHDTVTFLGTFMWYIKGFRYRPDNSDAHLKLLKDDIKRLRDVSNPSDAALVLLAAVAEMFERAITFIVRPGELIGERSIGLNADKSLGPTPADKVKISLAKTSIFRDVIERAQVYYGDGSDETTKQFFQAIGEPITPVVLVLPVLCDKKVIAVVYGDFGLKDASPVQLDLLEIVAQQVGIVLEYALFRRQVAKVAPKTESKN